MDDCILGVDELVDVGHEVGDVVSAGFMGKSLRLVTPFL
jgi:hypothetical protein